MEKPKLLLHTCCAPCSGFLAHQLLRDFDLLIYFQNSNIWPVQEYHRRLEEAKKFFQKEGLEFFEDDYDHEAWLESVAGLEGEPERGKRCEECYRFRLARAARFAQARGFDFFATTLSISPHKDAKVINSVGEKIAQEKGIKFLSGDWKKFDGFKNAMVFSHDQGFYHQNYCGCEFSLRK